MAVESQASGLPQGADASWTACPPGAMRQVVAGLRAKKRWSVFGQAGTVVAMLLVAGVGLWFALDRYIYGGFEPTSAYGMTCPEVLDCLPEYIAGRLDDEDQVADIEWHLQRCRRCEDQYRAKGGTKVFASASGTDLQNAAFSSPGGASGGGCAKPCCGSGSK